LTIFIRHVPKTGNAIDLEAFVARVRKLLGSISKVQQNILNAELAISYAKLRDETRTRKQAEAISVDRKDDVPCSSPELLLGALLHAGLDNEIQQLFGLCNIALAGQAELWRMAASASLADGFPKLALKAVQKIAVPLLSGEPFVDAIQTMLAV